MSTNQGFLKYLIIRDKKTGKNRYCYNIDTLIEKYIVSEKKYFLNYNNDTVNYRKINSKYYAFINNNLFDNTGHNEANGRIGNDFISGDKFLEQKSISDLSGLDSWFKPEIYNYRIGQLWYISSYYGIDLPNYSTIAYFKLPKIIVEINIGDEVNRFNEKLYKASKLHQDSIAHEVEMNRKFEYEKIKQKTFEYNEIANKYLITADSFSTLMIYNAALLYSQKSIKEFEKGIDGLNDVDLSEQNQRVNDAKILSDKFEKLHLEQFENNKNIFYSQRGISEKQFKEYKYDFNPQTWVYFGRDSVESIIRSYISNYYPKYLSTYINCQKYFRDSLNFYEKQKNHLYKKSSISILGFDPLNLPYNYFTIQYLNLLNTYTLFLEKHKDYLYKIYCRNKFYKDNSLEVPLIINKKAIKIFKDEDSIEIIINKVLALD